jgi:hypothetical protein
MRAKVENWKFKVHRPREGGDPWHLSFTQYWF